MKYAFESRVRYSEVDENAQLTIGALVNYFQDVAAFQSEDRGVGVQYLKEHHQAWILSYWQIVIDHLPNLGDRVTARTWPYEFRMFYGNRNLDLLGADGRPYAWANSVWVLMDMEKQKPIRVTDDMLRAYETSEKLDMDYAPRKIRVPEGGKAQEPFKITRDRLDTNHHVNNQQYILMAADYLPAGCRIRELRAEYLQQAHLGDIICPVVTEKDDLVAVSLNREDGSPYAVVQWAGAAR